MHELYFHKVVNIRFWRQYNKFKLLTKSLNWINFERKMSWPRTRIPSLKKSCQTNFIAPLKKQHHKIPRLASKEHSEKYLDFSKMYDIFCDVLLGGVGWKRKLDGRRGG